MLKYELWEIVCHSLKQVGPRMCVVFNYSDTNFHVIHGPLKVINIFMSAEKEMFACGPLLFSVLVKLLWALSRFSSDYKRVKREYQRRSASALVSAVVRLRRGKCMLPPVRTLSSSRIERAFITTDLSRGDPALARPETVWSISRLSGTPPTQTSSAPFVNALTGGRGAHFILTQMPW